MNKEDTIGHKGVKYVIAENVFFDRYDRREVVRLSAVEASMQNSCSFLLVYFITFLDEIKIAIPLLPLDAVLR